jgi:outer membrane protein OmpA-like peptidoglycan-associated protein
MSRSNFTAGRAALALLPCIALAGCATPQSVSEQTDALNSRLAGIERELGDTRSIATAALGQATAAQRQMQELHSGLTARLHPLEARLGTLEERQLAQAASLGQARQQLAQAVATAEDALRQATAASKDNREQTAQLAALTAEARSLQERLAALQAQLQGQDRRLAETEARVAQAATLGQNALNQAMQGIRRVEGKVLLSVTLSGARARYPLNLDELDARDIRRLDELIARLATLGDDYHLEIEGHSDDNGAVEYNYLLAEAHANAVARYLHGRGGIPLQRMSVISYGASRASAGHARLVDAGSNQRVEIRVVR